MTVDHQSKTVPAEIIPRGKENDRIGVDTIKRFSEDAQIHKLLLKPYEPSLKLLIYGLWTHGQTSTDWTTRQCLDELRFVANEQNAFECLC